MRTLQYHEAKQRGSMEFPLDYHYIDRNHARYEMPYHWHEETEILFVLNGNRPETDTAEKNIRYLKTIEAEIGLPVTGLVNNTHMLRETTKDDLDRGMELAREVSGIAGIPIKFHSIIKELMPAACQEDVFPLTLFMRPEWLDR